MKSYTATGLALLFALGLATSAADVQAAGDQAPEAAPSTEAGATPTSPALPESTDAGDAATPPEATAEAGATVCPPGQDCPPEAMTSEQHQAAGDTAGAEGPALPESAEAGDAATPPEATAEAGSTVCPPGQECPTEEMTSEQERATGDTAAVDEDAEEEEGVSQ